MKLRFIFLGALGLLGLAAQAQVRGTLTLRDGRVVSVTVRQPILAGSLELSSQADRVPRIPARTGRVLVLADGREYHSVTVPLGIPSDSGFVWAERLAAGPLSLYRYHPVPDRQSLVFTWNGRTLQLAPEAWRRQLADSLPACPSQPTAWRQPSANLERLTEQIDAYNACLVQATAPSPGATPPTQPQAARKPRERVVTLTAVGGLQQFRYSRDFRLGVEEAFGSRLISMPTPSRGMGGLRFATGNQSGQSFEAFAQLGLVWHQADLELTPSLVILGGQQQRVRRIIQLDIRYLAVQGGLRWYPVRWGRVRPFAAVSLQALVHQRNASTGPLVDPATGTVQHLPIQFLNQTYVHALGSLGAQVNLADRWLLEAELTLWGPQASLEGPQTIDFAFNAAQIGVGYRWRRS